MINVSDNSQNQQQATTSFTIDTTPPTITANLSTPANANGWHNEDVIVTFEASDASGIANITPDVTVSIEGENQVITGTATDQAGNTASVSVTINLDKTAPTLTANLSTSANGNGWHKENLTISYTTQDNLSGVQATPQNEVITTEGENQQITKTITDLAGNTTSQTTTINLDKTAPTIIANLSQQPNANDWFNQDITISYIAEDSLSGLEENPQDDIITTEGENQQITKTVTDLAGNIASQTTTINLDKTAPTIAANLSQQPNANNWHKQDVTITFSKQDSLSGLQDPQPDEVITVNTEGENQQFTRTATDLAGNTASQTITINLDKTAPTITANISPEANAQGFHNQDVAISFVVTDSLSGIDTSTPDITVTEDGEQQVTGVATDLETSRGRWLTCFSLRTSAYLTFVL